MKAKSVAEEFPNFRLGDLLRLSVFIADNMHGPVPTSMRASAELLKGRQTHNGEPSSPIKKQPSHKRMMRTIDTIEEATKQLIIYRVAINEDGSNSSRTITSYDEALELDKNIAEKVPGAKGTRRLPGAITPYAKLWYLYGEIAGELFDKIAQSSTPSAMEHELTKARATLGLQDVLSGPYQRDEEVLPDRGP